MVQFNDNFSKERIADLYTHEEERYVQAMAPQLGFEYINLQGYTINPAALAAIPEHEAMKGNLVGFEISQQNISIAAKVPNDPGTQAVLQKLQQQRYNITLYMCSKASLDHAWKRYKDIKESNAARKGVFEINPEDVERLTKQIKTVDDVLTTLKKIRTANSARRISETLELIFAGAIALGTSDIHIEPEQAGIRLRYRFDGVLHDIADLETFMHKRLMSRFKLLAGMKLNNKAEAQDGRFTFEMVNRAIEVRASVIPGALGESIVMRLLDPSVASFTMDKLSLGPKLREVMEAELTKPNGLILTTGPTGSGKTTALYAFLQQTHEEGTKIITIENPVEYKIEGMVQTQTDENYTFASGLRAILRQDPDVIMIGEIRDKEVAETAMHAAQTGHLVFSTLHTNSAVASFARLIDLGVDPNMLGTSINVILGQRLVRLLCEACKKARQATPSETALIKHVLSTHPQAPKITEPISVCTPVGCSKCQMTGYKGRVGIFEAVLMDNAVEEAVLRDPREHIIMAAARPQGIPTMSEDGVAKVLQGLTSLDELGRVIELPHLTAASYTTETPAPKTETGADDFTSHIV